MAGGVDPDSRAVAALLRFASSCGYGRRWKAALRSCWQASNYPGVPEQDVPLLQGLRNNYGPSWLARIRLVDLTRLADSADLVDIANAALARRKPATPEVP